MTELARHNGEISFWYAETSRPRRRAPLPGERSAEVCVVGGGFTGLWTAYYLKRAVPEMDIVVVEREFAGFGASGRNGGWLSSDFATPRAAMASPDGRDGVLALQRAMRATVDEVISICEREHDRRRHRQARHDPGRAQSRAARAPASRCGRCAELGDGARGSPRARRGESGGAHPCRRWARRHVDAVRRARAAGQASPGVGRRRGASRSADLRGDGRAGDHARNRADRSRRRSTRASSSAASRASPPVCAASTAPCFRSTRP